MRRVEREQRRAAGLLSLVPPDMDVKGHIRAVLANASDGTGAPALGDDDD